MLTLYSKPNCMQCKFTKEYLSNHNIKYKEINETLSKELEDILKLKKKSNGGNYVNNLKFRMDRNFFNYVENAVNENRLSYTDAFSIVGVGYKGYKILSNRGG